MGLQYFHLQIPMYTSPSDNAANAPCLDCIPNRDPTANICACFFLSCALPSNHVYAPRSMNAPVPVSGSVMEPYERQVCRRTYQLCGKIYSRYPCPVSGCRLVSRASGVLRALGRLNSLPLLKCSRSGGFYNEQPLVCGERSKRQDSNSVLFRV